MCYWYKRSSCRYIDKISQSKYILKIKIMEIEEVNVDDGVQENIIQQGSSYVGYTCKSYVKMKRFG